MDERNDPDDMKRDRVRRQMMNHLVEQLVSEYIPLQNLRYRHCASFITAS
jgi:hypothetical protein